MAKHEFGIPTRFCVDLRKRLRDGLAAGDELYGLGGFVLTRGLGYGDLGSDDKRVVFFIDPHRHYDCGFLHVDESEIPRKEEKRKREHDQ